MVAKTLNDRESDEAVQGKISKKKKKKGTIIKRPVMFVLLLLSIASLFSFTVGDMFKKKRKNMGDDTLRESSSAIEMEMMSAMVDGNEDEGGDLVGKTQFEKKKRKKRDLGVDDDQDDDRDDDAVAGVDVETNRDEECAEKKMITKARKTRTSWAFRANDKLMYAHMPTHVTKEKVVLVAFQGARRSEGQSNQRIYLSRSEDGGKTFESIPKTLNSLIVSSKSSSSSSSRTREEREIEAQWGPALFKDDDDDDKTALVRLYFSQSEQCWFCRRAKTCAMDQKEFRAGGNLFETISHDLGRTWSQPKMILKEKEKDAKRGGYAPKVIANPPIRVPSSSSSSLLFSSNSSSGSTIKEEESNNNKKKKKKRTSMIVLPYWTQKPRVGANGIVSLCSSEMRARDASRALYSKDDGKSWLPLGDAIKHEDAHRKAPEIDRLLEGAVVFSNKKVMQFFRATRPRVYATIFDERKAQWGKPFPVRAADANNGTAKNNKKQQHHHHHSHRDDFLKMPNSKLHAISISQNSNQILLAHNDHHYAARLRDNLVLQISSGINDDGNAVAPFHKLLDIETKANNQRTSGTERMIMYPHIERSGNCADFSISYSDHGRGIKIVFITVE
jgi:hypothetical protein